MEIVAISIQTLECKITNFENQPWFSLNFIFPILYALQDLLRSAYELNYYGYFAGGNFHSFRSCELRVEQSRFSIRVDLALLFLYLVVQSEYFKHAVFLVTKK